MKKSSPIASLLIKGAEVWTDGEFKRVDVRINDGRVSEIERSIQPGSEERVVDATGCHLLPGLVDLHVHFREPGYSYKETIATGTEAAARGGFTLVCAMPNVNPVPDSLEHLQTQLDIIESDALIEVLPYASITINRSGKKPVDHAALVGMTAGFSDDGSGVQDELMMRDCMSSVADTGAMLAAHCEVESLLDGGYIHDGEWAKRHGHRGICSRSEWEEIERDIRLAAETGCRLHICHISTKEGVDAVRQAKEAGLPVTCETGPHYLAFCDEDLQDEGRFKMNPPLRSDADRRALREGVADGTIDVIATDHAPHSADEKSRGLEKSAMGVVGLETSLAAIYTFMVKGGEISLERLVDIMSLTPRRLLGRDTDVIRVGAAADMVLADFHKDYTVDPAEFKSKGRSTPFEGAVLSGEVMMTMADGRIVYDTLSAYSGFRQYRVLENKKIARKTWRMRLAGETGMLHSPGQFVNIVIPGKFLRRPISVSGYDSDGLTLLYDVVGAGTEEMSRLKAGDTIEMLNGLGNGFDVEFGIKKGLSDKTPLLIGGGIGDAPLIGLACDLLARGIRPVAVLGFASGSDISGADELQSLGVETYVATVDGTMGHEGFVTDLIASLDREFGYFYACGPLPMLRAVCTQLDIPGQVSMESRMGCGFGVCMCCSLELKSGPARICKEGPVFDKDELIWK